LTEDGVAGADGRDIRDVKWKKRGEEREWDVGKGRLGFEATNDDDNGEDEVTNAGGDEGDVEPNSNADTKHKGRSDRGERRAKIKARGSEALAWQRPQNGLLKQFKSALR
jgi:hypothetical protein